MISVRAGHCTGCQKWLVTPLLFNIPYVCISNVNKIILLFYNYYCYHIWLIRSKVFYITQKFIEMGAGNMLWLFLAVTLVKLLLLGMLDCVLILRVKCSLMLRW